MTTSDLIQLKIAELETYEKKFNDMHRWAKYFKINTLQPKQKELRDLIDKRNRELKSKDK